MALVYEVWIDRCDPPEDGTLVVVSTVTDTGQKMLIDSEHFSESDRTADEIAAWLWYRIRELERRSQV